MAEISTVEEATKKAEQFLGRYHAFMTLKSVKKMKSENEWVLEYDVGIITSEIVNIRLDGRTGEIIEYKGTQ